MPFANANIPFVINNPVIYHNNRLIYKLIQIITSRTGKPAPHNRFYPSRRATNGDTPTKLNG